MEKQVIQGKNLSNTFAGIYTFFGIFQVASVSFLVPLFANLGYDTGMIGILSSVATLISFVAQPLWGMLFDSRGCVKQVFVANALITCASLFALCTYGTNIFVAFTAMTVFGLTMYTIQPIIDAWITKLRAENHKVDFGFARSFSSLTYAIASLGIGYAITRFDYVVLPGIATIFALVMIAFAITVPRTRAQSKTEKHPSMFSGLPILLRNRKYMAILISSVVLFFACDGVFTFLALFLEELGGNEFHLGLMNFIDAMLQVPVLLLYKKIEKRFSAPKILIFSMLAYTVKLVLMPLMPTLWSLIGLQFIGLLTYGLFLPSAISCIASGTTGEYAFTAQTLFTAMCFGASAALGALFGGFLADLIGLKYMMLIMSIGSVIAPLIFVFMYGPSDIRKSVVTPVEK